MLFLVTIYGKHDEEYAQFEVTANSVREALDLGIEKYGLDDWYEVGARKLS